MHLQCCLQAVELSCVAECTIWLPLVLRKIFPAPLWSSFSFFPFNLSVLCELQEDSLFVCTSFGMWCTAASGVFFALAMHSTSPGKEQSHLPSTLSICSLLWKEQSISLEWANQMFVIHFEKHGFLLRFFFWSFFLSVLGFCLFGFFVVLFFTYCLFVGLVWSFKYMCAWIFLKELKLLSNALLFTVLSLKSYILDKLNTASAAGITFIHIHEHKYT